MILAPFAVSAAIGVGKAIVGDLAAGLSGNGKAKSLAESQSAVDGKSALDGKAAAKARKTATEFETMFLENTLDKLTASEGTDGPLGENGTGGGVYRSMLTKEYAGQIVKSGGVGIGDQVFREMMRMQEASRGAA
ncbi:rod-binding protein [Methylobacterium sp. Leaf108]|uniref:rod-binding protein n=1 Tax=Methylobacterium sp. Leaf108 TaxID=1736256 RepID=UPI0006FBBC72|nr:rod-binding protein [Methylobacterium sp. Leaf108]KQP50544.1 hypothetical protein ASF39_12710 [Methylobacterium sp. Leaf108]